MGVLIVVGDLVGRGNQSAKRATPLHVVIGRTDRKAVLVPCELTAAPMALVLDESARLLDNLNLEWFLRVRQLAGPAVRRCPAACDTAVRGTARGLS